jgi:hypothetical protein
VELLDWESGTTGNINWREQLKRDVVAADVGNFERTLNEAFVSKIVRTIMRVRPHERPALIAP